MIATHLLQVERIQAFLGPVYTRHGIGSGDGVQNGAATETDITRVDCQVLSWRHRPLGDLKEDTDIAGSVVMDDAGDRILAMSELHRQFVGGARIVGPDPIGADSTIFI